MCLANCPTIRNLTHICLTIGIQIDQYRASIGLHNNVRLQRGSRRDDTQVIQVMYSLLLSIFYFKLADYFYKAASFNHWNIILTLIGGFGILSDMTFECANNQNANDPNSIIIVDKIYCEVTYQYEPPPGVYYYCARVIL